MKTIQLIFWLIITTVTSGNGQTQIPKILNTAGGSYENGYVSVAWSIGELGLVNQMKTVDASYIFTNGFIQPEQANFSPDSRIEFSSDKIQIFPNPTHDIVEIDFFQNTIGKIKLQLFDNAGQIVYTHEKFNYGYGFIEKINMEGFAKGAYILQIKRLNPEPGQFNIESQSYKIVKL